MRTFSGKTTETNDFLEQPIVFSSAIDNFVLKNSFSKRLKLIESEQIKIHVNGS